MEKLLCLVMNLLICGWSKEPTKSLTHCDLEDGGTLCSITLANCCFTTQNTVIFIHTPVIFYV